MNTKTHRINLSRNVRRLSRLDLPGGGQVVINGNHAFIGHMQPPHGTSIVDVSDPRRPRIAARIDIDARSHSHKVRVHGDIMITNVEQHRRHLLRRGARLPEAERELRSQLARDPSEQELAEAIGVETGEMESLRASLRDGYREGGFRIWDVSDRTRPRLLRHQKTHGFGAHRFDMDERYAYISTEMEGFIGNILVIYDIFEPAQTVEVSRWWLPGQHTGGGEAPNWSGCSKRLHHALRDGDELWAAVWHGGIRVIDVSDITAPRTVGVHDYHPWVKEPTHTVLPARCRLGGRRIVVACDEEHQHTHGQPHAGLWILDATDRADIQPLATFHVSERDSPFARSPGRFGMHQFAEHIDDELVFCAWFAGGLRIVDISDPVWPREAGHFIPEPAPGAASPQSNDVDVDARGLIYVIDRVAGLDILEYRR